MRSGVHQPTYRSWQMMKNRCLNPKAMDYAYYGARGITVPKKWHTYEGFLADMGERPAGTTLDRKNNDKSYSKGNCRWVDRTTQARNRSIVIKLTYGNLTLNTWDWAKRLNLSFHGFHTRLHVHRSGKMSLDKLFAPRTTHYRRDRGLGT